MESTFYNTPTAVYRLLYDEASNVVQVRYYDKRLKYPVTSEDGLVRGAEYPVNDLANMPNVKADLNYGRLIMDFKKGDPITVKMGPGSDMEVEQAINAIGLTNLR